MLKLSNPFGTEETEFESNAFITEDYIILSRKNNLN